MLTNNTSHVHLESICHTACQLVMTWLFLHCHHGWKVKSIVFWNFCFGCFCCTKRDHKMQINSFDSSCSVFTVLVTAGTATHLSLCWTAVLHSTSMFPSEPLLYHVIHSSSPHLPPSIDPLHIPCSNNNWATSRTTSHSLRSDTQTHTHRGRTINPTCWGI